MHCLRCMPHLGAEAQRLHCACRCTAFDCCVLAVEFFLIDSSIDRSCFDRAKITSRSLSEARARLGCGRGGMVRRGGVVPRRGAAVVKETSLVAAVGKK